MVNQATASPSNYTCSVSGLAVAASATDIFLITGSATKVIKIKKFIISGTQTTSGSISILINKRSTDNTGGTFSNPAIVPFDSSYPTATAVVRAYTANPTALGTLVGMVKIRKLCLPVAAGNGSPVDTYVEEFDLLALRGVTEVLAFNLNATTITGGSINLSIEWEEE